MKRRGLTVFLLIIIILLGLEIFLPVWAGKRIEQVIISHTESIKQLEVEVNSFPAVEMFFSRADHVRLEADDIMVSDLMITSFSAGFNKIIIRDSEIIGDNEDLNVVITEQALNDYVKARYPDLDNFKLQLNPGQVYLGGYISFFDARIEVQLAGSFSITEQNKIYFIPQELQFAEVKIPGTFVQSLISDMDFAFDLNQLSIPLNVEEVKISSGELYLLGGLSVRKAGL